MKCGYNRNSIPTDRMCDLLNFRIANFRDSAHHEAFVDYLKIQLRIRFGPLLELMNTSLSSVEDGYREIERLIESYQEGAQYHVNGSRIIYSCTLSLSMCH